MYYHDPMQGILTCNPRTVQCLNRKNIVSYHGSAGDTLQGIFFTAMPIAMSDDAHAMDMDDANMLSVAMRTSPEDLTAGEYVDELSLVLPGPYALPEVQKTGRVYLDETSQVTYYDWD